MADVLSKMESARLAAIRFPLIIMVIYIHAKSGNISFGDGSVSINSNYVEIIKSIISDGLARSSVPLFFMMSGYLMFLGMNTWSNSIFLKKLERRFHTLFVPYIFWNVSLFCALYIAQSIPDLLIFFSSSGLLGEMSWVQRARLILGLEQYPIAYQFWFIRDLMVLTLAGPLWFFLARNALISIFIIATLGVFWLVDWWPIVIPSCEATLFFFVGAVVGVKGRSLFFRIPFYPLLVSYFSLIVLFISIRGTELSSFFQHILVATGVFLALEIFSKLPESVIKNLSSLSLASFFVFAIHEPLTTIFIKITYRFIPVSPFMALTVYFLVPLFVAALSLLVYRGAMCAFPGVTRRVTGR